MKASKALIAWTPAGWDSPTAGQVKIGRLLKYGESDWAAPYDFTGGAAHMSTRKLDGAEAVARVFIEFNTLVVRDGIDPQVAHREFLKIDEYAEHISPDIEGARDPDDDA